MPLVPSSVFHVVSGETKIFSSFAKGKEFVRACKRIGPDKFDGGSLQKDGPPAPKKIIAP